MEQSSITPQKQASVPHDDDFQKAILLHQQHKLPEAEHLYRRILTENPDHFDASHMLGVIAYDAGRPDEAIHFFERALQTKSTFAPLHLNHANALLALQRLDEALESYDKALRLKPDYFKALYNRGVALKEQKRFSEALVSYDAAISIKADDPHAHWNKALTELLLGHFAEGLRSYEWRKLTAQPMGNRTYPKPLWLGEDDIAGKTILIHWEQGLGDTIQFCRYVPLLAQMGAHVLFAPQTSLKRLMSPLANVCDIVDATDPHLEFDHHCPLLSLPLAFKTDLATIPDQSPYLQADSDLILKWRRALGETGFKIGICWQGSTRRIDAGRSFPLRQFAALSAIPGVRLISLHKGEGEGQLHEIPEGMVVETLGPDFDSGPDAFTDTAAVMTCCDLVITSDTAVAHLAGALGIKTWVALKYVPDWRWLLDREDSPWHPTMRLFRQKSMGDWDGVFADIREALESLLQFSEPSSTKSRPAPAVIAGARLGRGTIPVSRSTYMETPREPAQEISQNRDGLQTELSGEAVIAHTNLLQRAVLLHQEGHLSAAKKLYSQVLKTSPENFDALHLLGALAFQNRSLHEAIAFFERALKINPHFAPLQFNLGNALKELGEFGKAIQIYDKAISIHPDYPEAFNNRGVTLQNLKKLHEALASYERAIAVQPKYAEAFYNRGIVLKELNRLDEAVESYGRAISIRPDYAEAFYNRGIALKELNRFDEALASYDKAISVQPDYADACWNKGLLNLLLGRLQEGFSLYEARKLKSEPSGARTYPKPLWLGEDDLAGKTILIHWEQGLGDTIQFCRYVLLLAKMGAKVLFAPQTSLKRLMSALATVCALVDATDPHLEFDHHCPLLSLPLAFKTDLATIPSQSPYLQADPDLILKWRQALGENGFKIGICWQGSAGKVDAGRSFPLRQFAALSGVPGIRLISLHKGEGEGQLHDLPEGMVVETLGSDFDSGPDAFTDTAAVMKCCDLVITSDTAVAHLAGALGIKTWVALKYVPDWRWLLDREDSPWYPTMRLFRQKSIGDWDGVFADIREALGAEVSVCELTAASHSEMSASKGSNPVLKTKITKHGSTTFLTISNDIWVGRSLEAYGEWSHGEIDALAQLLKPDSNVIEVGANIGSHTVFLARDLCPDGKVFAFEPRRVLFQVLCANLALNGIQNVFAYQLGCGDVQEEIEEGAIDFTVPLNAGGLHLGSVQGAAEKIGIVRIDDFIGRSERIALIKADVEGFELRVLLGAEQTIKRTRPILYLENDRVHLSRSLLIHLSEIGYDVWWHKVPLFRTNNRANNHENIFRGVSSFNILCFPKEKNVHITNLEKVTDPDRHPLKKGD